MSRLPPFLLVCLVVLSPAATEGQDFSLRPSLEALVPVPRLSLAVDQPQRPQVATQVDPAIEHAVEEPRVALVVGSLRLGEVPDRPSTKNTLNSDSARLIVTGRPFAATCSSATVTMVRRLVAPVTVTAAAFVTSSNFIFPLLRKSL